MSRYIELGDKYRIEQSFPPSDYDPPSYIWTDNTGEIVKCADCKYYSQRMYSCSIISGTWRGHDYCSKAEKRKD